MDAVTAYNVDKLHHNSQPVAEIKAILSAGGLDPVVHIAQGARVMLSSTCG